MVYIVLLWLINFFSSSIPTLRRPAKSNRHTYIMKNSSQYNWHRRTTLSAPIKKPARSRFSQPFQVCIGITSQATHNKSTATAGAAARHQNSAANSRDFKRQNTINGHGRPWPGWIMHSEYLIRPGFIESSARRPFVARSGTAKLHLLQYRNSSKWWACSRTGNL